MKKGHCLCGGVGFEYDGPELFVGHCHCESCRRQTSSPFTTFMGVSNGKWRWTRDTPKIFEFTKGQKRYFCGTCGAPVAYTSERWPDEVHFYAALLDDPGAVTPTAHFHWEERLPWGTPEDDLPKKTGTTVPLPNSRD